MKKDALTIYRQLLNLQDASFSRIDHEDAMVATVYKIVKHNGQQLILKVSDRVNDYLREIYFLQLFANTVPVPKIIQIVEPDTHLHGAILMECLPGSLLQTNTLTETLAYEIGRCLALIHLKRLPGYGDPIQRKLSSDPKAYFTLKFEEGLEECRHNLPTNLIQQCHEYYQTHLNLLDTVDGPCVVHRDYRPGNLMVHEGQLRGIIDWAGARASFAEEDFCSMDHGEWTNDSHIKKTFLAGYASVRPIPDYARVMPFLRLNKAIATIGFTVKRGTWNNSSSRLYQHNRQLLETIKDPKKFHFTPVDKAHRALVHHWLKQPHVAKWFYGQGLQNTFNYLDAFLDGASNGQYWLGYDHNRPFAFLITSSVEKPNDPLTKWCSKEGKAITLDFLIGENDFLGKGLSHEVIRQFLQMQFPDVAEVLIDPEATNSHAIHIYKKVGFVTLGEFIPLHSPHPHYMMHLDMQKLRKRL